MAHYINIHSVARCLALVFDGIVAEYCFNTGVFSTDKKQDGSVENRKKGKLLAHIGQCLLCVPFCLCAVL